MKGITNMKRIYQDDKGNDSSFRIVFLTFAVVLVWGMILFTMGALKEFAAKPIDFNGLATLFSAIFVGFALSLWAKAFSKKQE